MKPPGAALTLRGRPGMPPVAQCSLAHNKYNAGYERIVHEGILSGGFISKRHAKS